MLKSVDSSALNFTGYHGIDIIATLTQIENILGKSDGEGDYGKTSHVWCKELTDGRVFRVYDWKEGRIGRRKIAWHIGAKDKQTTIDARTVLMELLHQK